MEGSEVHEEDHTSQASKVSAAIRIRIERCDQSGSLVVGRPARLIAAVEQPTKPLRQPGLFLFVVICATLVGVQSIDRLCKSAQST